MPDQRTAAVRAPQKAPAASSAWRATSTWRCTCRCATRTRPASCAMRDAARRRHRRRSKASSPTARSQYRPRRQLVVKIADDSGDLVLRFLNFYPSQQKALAAGTARARARRSARRLLRREMVHPTFKAVTGGDAVADGADAGLSEHGAAVAGVPAQGGRRAACARADLDRAPAARRRAHAAGLAWDLREALALSAPPAARCRRWRRSRTASHPAWQRLKFEELLAQQLSQLRKQARARSAARAARWRASARRCTSSCSPRCRSS